MEYAILNSFLMKKETTKKITDLLIICYVVTKWKKNFLIILCRV